MKLPIPDPSFLSSHNGSCGAQLFLYVTQSMGCKRDLCFTTSHQFYWSFTPSADNRELEHHSLFTMCILPSVSKLFPGNESNCSQWQQEGENRGNLRICLRLRKTKCQQKHFNSFRTPGFLSKISLAQVYCATKNKVFGLSSRNTCEILIGTRISRNLLPSGMKFDTLTNTGNFRKSHNQP